MMAETAGTIRLHAERTNDPNAIDWVVRDALLPTDVHLTRESMPPGTPVALADLLLSGAIAGLSVHGEALRVWRSLDVDWVELAPIVDQAIRRALQAGPWLASPTENTAATHIDEDSDYSLTSEVTELLAGPVGDYVASHGGSIELVGVHNGVVQLRLCGACQGCPAATQTLKYGIENQLKACCPQLRGVEAV